MTSGTSISLSLQELLNSGALNNSTFQLKNDPPASTPYVPHLSSDKLLQMLNAAKISLILARAFAKFQLSHSSEDVSSLQLGDFLIHLGYSLQLQQQQQQQQPVQVIVPTEHLEPLSFVEGQEEDDETLQCISEFFESDKPLPRWTPDRLQPHKTTAHYSFEHSGRGQQQISFTDNREPTASELSFHDVIAAAGFDRVWTIIGIDCIPLISRNVSTRTPEQTLGDLIHFIFSGGSLSLTSTLNQKSSENADSSTEQRDARMKRNATVTLFSTLVGVDTLPTSICRLLSDLLCETLSGSEERLNVSPISVHDVIQDLEHMCVYPQIYLYDPGTEFYSTNLLFGQRLYGRKGELTQLLGVSTRLEGGSISNGSECILVSGGAGSGKSHLVNNVVAFLSNIGWVLSSASCGRDMAHRSSETVLSLLDTLIVNIVATYNNEGKSATDALLKVLDSTTLFSLSAYLPSLGSLTGNTDRSTSPNNRSVVSQLQLTYLLSQLMSAILSLNRRIVMFLDNFEHADSSALALLSEILTSVGRLPSGRSNFLFIGCYRDDIDKRHPLTAQLAELRRDQDISLTEIRLNKLSMDDVTDIIMTELRLPRRLVLELANIVHKITSGHALFVVQLLNSLVRDSVLAYSPMKRRFDWDPIKVRNLKTEGSVASLIVANLNSLNPGELFLLRVLSCFGIQVKLSVVALLKDTFPNGGVEAQLQSLIEGGVVEMKDSLVVFTHDLIQQGVYDNIPSEQRSQLHLNISLCLAMKLSLDQHAMAGQLEEMDVNRLSFEDMSNVESQEMITIIGVAANQVNCVDPTSIERSQRVRFARWNMVAATKFAKAFNFGASANYCRKGIGLLYDCLWCEETYELCRGFHEGAASALLFLGDSSDAQQYANVLIDNVPFADSIAAEYIVLRSLEQMGKYDEQVARGLTVLRGLNLDIPQEPSLSVTMDAMAQTSSIASKYSIEQITELRGGKVDARKKNILLSLNSIMVGAFRSSSQLLPLITCAVVNYSLQNGVYEECALSFAFFGYFKIGLVGDYNEGRYWVNATKQILKKSRTSVASNRARLVLSMFVEWFYVSLRETDFNLLSINKSAVAMGDVESAIISMIFSLRFSLYAGEKLSSLLKSFYDLLQTMTRFKELAKTTLVDLVLIEDLIGTESNAFDVFGCTIPSENFILTDASTKQDMISIELIQLRRFFSSFWRGDYQKANDFYDVASSLPSFKNPKVWTVVSQCYRGIIAFHLYTEGKGQEWLDEGREMLQKFELLGEVSTDVHENKRLLLQAEFHACSGEVGKAKELFEASIKSAGDLEFIHEQGLAFELYGKFLVSTAENNEALDCFKSAHMCYVKWGALAIAEHVRMKYRLSTYEGVSQSATSNKHCRSW